MEAVDQFLVREGFFKRGAGDAFFQSDEDFGAGLGFEEIPQFGLGFAVQGCGQFFRGVDLEREVVAGVEDFDEDGKAFGSGGFAAEEIGAIFGRPQIMERAAGLVDDRLGLGPVADFPGFADAVAGEGAAEEGVDVLSAPDAVVVGRGKGMDRHGVVILESRPAMSIGKVGEGFEQKVTELTEQGREWGRNEGCGFRAFSVFIGGQAPLASHTRPRARSPEP